MAIRRFSRRQWLGFDPGCRRARLVACAGSGYGYRSCSENVRAKPSRGRDRTSCAMAKNARTCSLAISTPVSSGPAANQLPSKPTRMPGSESASSASAMGGPSPRRRRAQSRRKLTEDSLGGGGRSPSSGTERKHLDGRVLGDVRSQHAVLAGERLAQLLRKRDDQRRAPRRRPGGSQRPLRCR